MKHACKRTREQWALYRKGALPDIRELRDVEKHLQTCADCRAFAYRENLSFILQASYAETPPEPPAHFFTELAKKLNALDIQGRKASFTEILLDKGWRLVPAMAVVVVFLAGSIAYQFTALSKLTAQSSFEETVLYEGALFEESDVISAILGGGVSNGNE